MKISANFSKEEFDCKCGCDMPVSAFYNVVKLAQNLQYVRDYLGKPIHVNSGYRCEAHNAKVGGSETSQHLLGKAADIHCSDIKSNILHELINDLIDKGEILQGGLGLYDTFVHYDIRKTKARW